MPILTLDTVANFGANITNNATELVRGFFLEDIDTSIQPYAICGYVKNYTAMMDDNGVGMPMAFEPYPDTGNFPGLLMLSVIIEGIMPNAVAGRLIYRKPGGPGDFTPSVYTITKTRQIIQHTENILPNGERIFADYWNAFGDTIVEDFVPMTFRRPSPVVVFEGIKAGSPDDGGSDYIGCVKDATFRSRPIGGWMLDDWTTNFSKYTGYSQFRIQIIGNVLGRDWGTLGTLYNSLVGKYVDVDEGDISTALGIPYKYGIIQPSAGTGVVRVGGYPTCSFTGIGVPA